MTSKKIKTSDILGSNYYTYELSSSNYTPSLNATITITCTCKSVYGDVVGSKSLTLYKNGSSVSSQTTNSSGVATWSNISCSTAGLQKYSVGDTVIEVFVDTTSKTGHTHTTSDITNFPSTITPSSHAHGNLQNDGSVGTSNNASKNVVTDSNGKITTEAKPTIPSKISDLTNDSNFIETSSTTGLIKNDGSIMTSGTGSSNWAVGNHSHSGYASSTHNHTTSDITDFPTIPVDVGDLTDEHNVLYDLVHFSDLGAVATSNLYEDLDNLPTIPEDIGDLTDTDGVLTDLAYQNDIPTKTSDLTNDADGTSGATYVLSTDSRLSDSRTPTSHTHGNLQNNGQVGSSATNNGIVLTDSSGKITASTSIAKQTIALGTSSNASKNVVTDSNGKITTEDKYVYSHPTEIQCKHTHDLSDLTDNNSILHFEDYVAYDDISGISLSDFNNDLSIPVYTSDLTNDGSDGSDTYVESGSLSTVATSGSYNDLIDKPVITATTNLPTASSTYEGKICILTKNNGIELYFCDK